MCRLVGYLGERIALGQLVEAPPHSLLKQSWKARELVSATVNADGWGAGLFVEEDPHPCLYASTLPIWADPNLPHLGRALRSHAILAQVRSATDPHSLSHANTQPFGAGGLLFLHNGFVEEFRGRLRRRVSSALSDAAFAGIRGTTDSEHLFALIQDELERQGGVADGEALLAAATAATRRLVAWAVEAGSAAHFAVLLADGRSLVALRLSTAAEPPSLYLLPGPSPLAPGAVVASEPLDGDSGWQRVPPGHGVVASLGGSARLVELP